MTTDQVQRISRLPEAEESLKEAVYTAVGAASTTWNAQINGTDVFDDARAREVAEDLIKRVKVIVGLGDPHLGLATTAQIREELETRERLGFTAEDNYTTVTPGAPLWHLVQEPWVGKEAIWQHRDHPSIYSVDRGETWYDLNDGVDFEGNPRMHASLS